MLDKKELKEFVLTKLNQYSAIPSLSEKELEFLNFLEKDFSKDLPRPMRKVFIGKNPLYYYYAGDPWSNFFITVHTDRVRSFSGKVYTTPVITFNNEKEYIQGQLDNIIGIVAARFLLHMKVPVNILLTTREEQVASVPQVEEVCKLTNKIPISVDIDVFSDLTDFDNGLITLRDRDSAGKMLPALASYLRELAASLNIPFTVNDGWAAVETGFLARATEDKYQGAHIGIPLVNYHSDQEITSWDVVYNTITLLYEFFKIKGGQYAYNQNHKD